MGKGALDDRSLLSLPAVGVQARDSMTAGLDEADVVVCVGYDLVEFGPAAQGGKEAPQPQLVRADVRDEDVRRLHGGADREDRRLGADEPGPLDGGRQPVVTATRRRVA